MYHKEVQILNTLGLHARPAALLVKTANQFKADIKLFRDDIDVNAKSILGVMMLAAGPETSLTIMANGEDEEAAVKAIAKLFEEKFGEE
ncbi:HPr family phosphocarrier protein [Candidatus Riflebacteria bacterium]